MFSKFSDQYPWAVPSTQPPAEFTPVTDIHMMDATLVGKPVNASPNQDFRQKVWKLNCGVGDSGQCYCCGKTVTKSHWVCAPFTPPDQGGPLLVDNYRATCAACANYCHQNKVSIYDYRQQVKTPGS
jgi:hypothetical protein